MDDPTSSVLLLLVVVFALVAFFVWLFWAVAQDRKRRNDYEYFRQFRAMIQTKARELDDSAFANHEDWDYLLELARFSDTLATKLHSKIRGEVEKSGTLEQWVRKVKAGED